MKIDIRENIRIHKPTSNWRCAYCKGEIRSGELCIALYNIEKLQEIKDKGKIIQEGKFIQSGNGLKLHIGCLDDFYKTIKKTIKDNIKEIIMEKL